MQGCGSPRKKGPQCGLCLGLTFHAFLAPDLSLAAWTSLFCDLAGAAWPRLPVPWAAQGGVCVLKGFPHAPWLSTLNLCLGLSASTPPKKKFGAGISSKGVGLPLRYRQNAISADVAPGRARGRGILDPGGALESLRANLPCVAHWPHYIELPLSEPVSSSIKWVYQEPQDAWERSGAPAVFGEPSLPSSQTSPPSLPASLPATPPCLSSPTSSPPFLSLPPSPLQCPSLTLGDCDLQNAPWPLLSWSSNSTKAPGRWQKRYHGQQSCVIVMLSQRARTPGAHVPEAPVMGNGPLWPSSLGTTPAHSARALFVRKGACSVGR